MPGFMLRVHLLCASPEPGTGAARRVQVMPCLQVLPHQPGTKSKWERKGKKESTGEINNNYLFWQIMSTCRAICAHSSVPAHHQRGPALEPSSALGSIWAFHQLVIAWGKGLPASLSPAHCPPGGQAGMILKIQGGWARVWGWLGRVGYAPPPRPS